MKNFIAKIAYSTMLIVAGMLIMVACEKATESAPPTATPTATATEGTVTLNATPLPIPFTTANFSRSQGGFTMQISNGNGIPGNLIYFQANDGSGWWAMQKVGVNGPNQAFYSCTKVARICKPCFPCPKPPCPMTPETPDELVPVK